MGQAVRNAQEVPGPQVSRQAGKTQGLTQAGRGNLPQKLERPTEEGVRFGQADGEEQGREQLESGLLQAGEEGQLALLLAFLITILFRCDE